ncbi:unnamed protein product, partial [Bubo scandiacus]
VSTAWEMSYIIGGHANWHCLLAIVSGREEESSIARIKRVVLLHGVTNSGLKALSVEVSCCGLKLVTDTMVHADEGFYNTVVSKEEGSSPSTYEIIMVSLSGSLLLLVAISVAISVLW